MNIKQWKTLGSFIRNDNMNVLNIHKNGVNIRLLVQIHSKKTYTEIIIYESGAYSDTDKIQIG